MLQTANKLQQWLTAPSCKTTTEFRAFVLWVLLGDKLTNLVMTLKRKAAKVHTLDGIITMQMICVSAAFFQLSQVKRYIQKAQDMYIVKNPGL